MSICYTDRMKKFLYISVLLFFTIVTNGCDEWDRLVDSLGGNEDDDPTVSESTDTPGDKSDDNKDSSGSNEDEKDKDEDADIADTSKDSSDSSNEATLSKKFHHYNPKAFWGKGVAIIFCPYQKRMDSCKLNNKKMSLHGNQDEHRDVWKILGKTGISGTVICKQGGSSYSYEVSGKRMHYGNCN